MVNKWPFLKLEFSVFLPKLKNPVVKKNCDLFKNASQNDQLNLSFVKDINLVGDKMTRNGREMTNSKSCLFLTRVYRISSIFGLPKNRLPIAHPTPTRFLRPCSNEVTQTG